MEGRVVSGGMLALACLAGLCGCASVMPDRAAPQRVAAAGAVVPAAGPEAPEPAQPTIRSFFVRGNRYPIGQAALLWICVTPQGAISTVELVRSSGEASFDEFAMVWARQADVSGWVSKDQSKGSCGSVRVEIGHGRRRLLEQSADTALG